MNISAPFIARPVATTLLTAGILLVGVIAFNVLPVSPLPQVDFPTILSLGPACPVAVPRSPHPQLPHRWSASSAISPA